MNALTELKSFLAVFLVILSNAKAFLCKHLPYSSDCYIEISIDTMNTKSLLLPNYLRRYSYLDRCIHFFSGTNVCAEFICL